MSSWRIGCTVLHSRTATCTARTTFRIDAARLAADLPRVDPLPRGATAISDFSPQIEGRSSAAGLRDADVRRGAVRPAISSSALKTPHCAMRSIDINRQSERGAGGQTVREFRSDTGGSPEASQPDARGSAAGPARPARRRPWARRRRCSGSRSTSPSGRATATSTRHRTRRRDPPGDRHADAAAAEQPDPHRRGRRRQNRGRRGLRAANRAGDVPPPLRDVSLRVLDVGLLQAGASMKGEFEKRLRQVIEEVQSSPKPIILFIDEAHTLIGAGGGGGHRRCGQSAEAGPGTRHAAHHRGDDLGGIQAVLREGPGADPSLPGVKVEEPEEDKAIRMMRGIVPPLEKHHRVQILDEAIEAAVRLSHRYIPARQLPDKAVQPARHRRGARRGQPARHAAGGGGSPPAHPGAGDRASDLGRETAIGRRPAREASVPRRWAARQRRWPNWRHAGTREGAGRPGARAARSAARARRRGRPGRRLLAELAPFKAELDDVQGEHPLILPSVDEQAIAAVVEDWTGIPVAGW